MLLRRPTRRVRWNPVRQRAKSPPRRLLPGPPPGVPDDPWDMLPPPLPPGGHRPLPASILAETSDFDTPTLTRLGPVSTDSSIDAPHAWASQPEVSGQCLRGPRNWGPFWHHHGHPGQSWGHPVSALSQAIPRGSWGQPLTCVSTSSNPTNPQASCSQPCGGFCARSHPLVTTKDVTPGPHQVLSKMRSPQKPPTSFPASPMSSE